MAVTRQAWANHIFCDDASDLPAAGQFVGQKAWINDNPVLLKRWNGSSWDDVTPFFGAFGGGIDPLTLSPYLWLDAERDDVNYNDGDAVGTATDWSGNGRDLTQAAAGKKPTFKTGIVNSKAVYRFDGGDCLTRASVAMTTFTIFATFRASGTAGIIYEHGADINANDGAILYTSSPPIIGVKKGAVLSSRNGVADWGVQYEWFTVAHHYNGTHSLNKFWLANTWFSLVTGTGNEPGSGTVTATLNVGSRNDAASLGLTGDLATFGIFTPALTTTQVSGVSNYQAVRLNI